MIENLFSTPIYVARVDNFDKIQQEIEETLKKTDFSMISGWGRTHYLSTTDFNDDIIDKSLKKEIKKHLFKYKTEISSNFEYSDYEMISWFTKCGKDNYAHMHNHGASDISGVYYHKTNGEDGNLFFHTPNPFLDTNNFYMHLGNQWEHTPFEGKLLLFPGWLMHGVRENPTDNERISLSFNITFKNRV
tara:strand:- start:1101 stop:1667 length:567 start_codon:yes stop_codon:yes gene_type:complete